MARPTKPPGDRRDDRINPRFTTAERALIERNAVAFGISPSDFTRRRVLDYRLPPAFARERQTAALATALIRIGVNLNQIARHLNAGGERSAALERSLQALLERITAEMDRLYGPGSNGRGPQL